ncbi:MAG TPA: hypothetical protein P5318_03870 [Candidatus Hydrogenedentes bacterium]|nr:hypothetical protein [Candidatus Hydrogenedentota bacterium]HPC15286.1 hypothetical protein [Candidatus Hydrogenedentota bacterium]HRT19241.1 hypothetical protein [Candidatus Hydrogenedentota bacterium]HRT63321.1 hypothetical protein [Candidatus Hydrogenedentota bacterium]
MRSRPSEPLPVPVDTATVKAVPLEAETLVMAASAMLPACSWKSFTSTRRTYSLKTTVKLTLAALVGLAEARPMPVQDGAVVSVSQ